MTTYAIQTQDGWLELVVGEPVRVFDADLDDVITWQYADMLAWTPQFRTARGIKPIVEVDIPAGKVAVGSTLDDIDGKPLRLWVLADEPLSERKAALKAAVNAERDQRSRSPFAFGGHAFDYDSESQKRITGAGALAHIAITIKGKAPTDPRWHDGAEDFAWIAADNTLVPMDAATVLAFGATAAAWESAHIFTARALKDVIAAAADIEALLVIDVGAGWPA